MIKLTFIIGFIFFFTMMQSEIFGEEIAIDSTFSTSWDIFPFGEIGLITSLSLTAEIELLHDTSLVRIIFVPNDDYEYMIFEAYSLIVDSLSFSVREICDETCFLNQLRPYSVKIQVIDAEVRLTSLHYLNEEMENLPQLQFAAKRERDEEKIEIMNERIPAFNLSWTAGDNDLVALYYHDKKQLFGEGYNIRGFEYYQDGIFESLGHKDYAKASPDLVRKFDWRDRHGANDPLSKYWVPGRTGIGWLTRVKNQGTQSTCYSFGPMGAAEALANVYSDSLIDIDLSEAYYVICIDCNSSSECVLSSLTDTGSVTEYCLPYESLICNDMCQDPDTIFTIAYYSEVDHNNPDSIRKAIITKGPLLINYHLVGATMDHAATMAGYIFNPLDSTVNWIIKNSYGSTPGQQGYFFMPLDDIKSVFAPIGPVYINDDSIPVHCYDKDQDSLCFWGVGLKPQDCPCSSNIEDCDDNNKYVGGYDENYTCSCLLTYDPEIHHILSDTTWADTVYVNYTIMVDSGACMTITSYAAFSPEAKIVVSQGGELIIDGGHLTKACPELWRGIEVLGSDTVQYFDEYFGKITVENGAVIEYASNGIANHCVLCDPNYMGSGGIIHAENSIFRNNETDVLLAPFRNEWDNHELPYAGTFEKCQFVTTNELYEVTTPKAHAEIKDIYGVQFLGCIFKNESDINLFPHVTRGTGISGIDAQFYLGKYCNTPQTIPCVDLDSCKFMGLEYGIKALNCHSVRTLNLQDMIFENNLLGISLSGIYNASILSNKIRCPLYAKGISEDRFIGGIFLEGCNDYHLEGDSIYGFHFPWDTAYSYYGIGIKTSGPRNNEIYNNYFKKLAVGIYCIGENKDRDTLGLCLKCNDMSGNLNDFVVVSEENPPAGSHQGINKYQGNPNDSISDNAPAGNTFSYFPSPADHENLQYYNYLNEGEDIRYTHHNSENYRVRPLASNYTQETIELKEWINLRYEKDSACPSGIYGGGLKSYQDPRLTILEADNHIFTLTNQLNSLIDGGNTEELNFEVMTSMPDEALELRQELLSDSPYLSDTVMKQAILKEDVLPNAMIRDILQANPQSAKSSGVLNTLEERFDPMPDYMMAQIMEGKRLLGAKELLEAEIQHWRQIRSKAKADLFREFLLDTNVIDPIDSVIAFLDAENDLQSKYDLAFAYWNDHDTTNAFITLNNIPPQYNLNSRQALIHDQYESYFGIIKMMEDSNWTASDLDSASVANLYNLMEEGSPQIAAHVRGLLVKGGLHNYIETIVLPDLSKSSDPIIRPSHPFEDKSLRDNFLLFPNPARDFVIIYFTFVSIESDAYVTLHDLKGNLIKLIDIDGTENQVVIDLQRISCGLYMVSLYSGSRLIDSKKLSKVRD